jgi:hypothetical protein
VLYAATATPSYFSSPLLLGAFGLLLGIGAIAAALRRRRGKDRYPETYAASGGIIYTGVQIGCGGILLLGGAGLVVLSLVNRH